MSVSKNSYILDSLTNFYNLYSGVKGIIGYSVKRRPIFFFEIEKTERPLILIQCSMHAREYITSLFCLEEIKYFMHYSKVGHAIFIPCVNPDGVFISQTQIPLYKANYNGVDLNVNFDAQWGKGVQNVKVRGAENYIGPFPFSEPESMALRDFTLLRKPDMTISLHTKGEEIYYRFFQKPTELRRDYKLAQVISIFNGYPIKDISGSVGGYKDWCIEKLKIPALTIEMGKDEFCHPLDGEEALSDIISKNLGITEEVIKGLIKYGY